MDKAALQAIHAEGRLYIRSTLGNGASFHSWPDRLQRRAWDRPHGETPGAWRDAGPEKIAPHHGGLHAARFHALSYWIGPELYLMETAPDAVTVEVDDVVASSRARLVKRVETPPETWRRFAFACAEMLLPFPLHYNYLDDFRNKTRRADCDPALKAIFQHALESYDVEATIRSMQAALRDRRLPDRRDLERLEQTAMQSLIHKQGLGREVAFDYHNRAMLEAMQGIAALRFLYGGAPRDALGVAQTVLSHAAKAYEAAGCEQMNCMVKDGRVSEGLQALLADLPFRSHRTLAAVDFGGLARRGLMLDLNGKLMDVLNLHGFIPQEPPVRLGPLLQATAQKLRALEMPVAQQTATGLTQ